LAQLERQGFLKAYTVGRHKIYLNTALYDLVRRFGT
jgi:hypothetical protein